MPRKHKRIRTRKENDFDLIVSNAFDFLERALKEFEKTPKYSVIHFYAAIELIMKARLLWEHWTLVIAKNSDPDLTKFRTGDFQSVNIRDAKKRLEYTVQDGLTNTEYECFLRLSNHRNRIVHFYHPSQAGDDRELASIVAEQCLAWFYLTRIFNRWNEQFSSYHKIITKIDRAMHKYRKFLEAKFGALEPDIERLGNAGIVFLNCPSCGYKSFREDTGLYPVNCFDCLVCGFKDTGVVIDCPECGQTNKLIGEPFGECTHCSNGFDSDDVFNFLTKDFVPDHHDPDMLTVPVAHCEICDGYETVVRVNEQDRWICCSCFTLYGLEDIGHCDWCSSLCTGHLENSYLNGCVACHGLLGEDDGS